ncbi:helix-turn-helix domain-containing protein [Aquabacterium humicola]|uniref:helix-turn-helix domain-containing protein n=1 Tax=Aquabacterium humicola TaxID=3237377 RepID=UPI002543A6D6|nr:helix-turn-helix domain-containing protein [Rubrivivax pictus]
MPDTAALPDAPLRAALRACLRGGDDLRFLHHVQAVLLVSQGLSCARVARCFGCSRRSVERWVRCYRLEGCESLHVTHGRGRPARLTRSQLLQLRAEFALPPSSQGLAYDHWCGKLVRAHVERRFGVHISLRQSQRLLRRPG